MSPLFERLRAKRAMFISTVEISIFGAKIQTLLDIYDCGLAMFRWFLCDILPRKYRLNVDLLYKFFKVILIRKGQ